MKTVATWSDLRPFGVDLLTGEACSLMYRVLCDLTVQGKRVVERCLSVEIRSENWNSGPADDPHVASIMLTDEMLTPLAVFALLDAGCREVYTTDRGAVGIEESDSAEQVDRAKRVCKLQRRFAYQGPHQDRNEHMMSGRVR